MRTRDEPERNSRMIISLSFCSMSPCYGGRGGEGRGEGEGVGGERREGGWGGRGEGRRRRGGEREGVGGEREGGREGGRGGEREGEEREEREGGREGGREGREGRRRKYTHIYTQSHKGCTMAETVKSRECIFSVSQSTLRRVLTKMTACVMVRVSYRSHSVSSFHSCGMEQRFTSENVHEISTDLLFHLDVELFDSLECQLLFLDEDADWVSHEPLCHLQYISRHGSR